MIVEGLCSLVKKELNKNTEQKLIEVATKLFAKDGFEGASIREICRLAGVNISLISYYFGGKKELYERIVSGMVGNIISHMRSNMGFAELHAESLPDFSKFTLQQKKDFLFKAMNLIIDYFYSDKISDDLIMIFYREQITGGVQLNSMGYDVFRKLFASILDKDENDKEIIFRCITIIGQIHSARVFKQFSLKMMNQETYTQDDIDLFKNIVLGQIKLGLEGALNEK